MNHEDTITIPKPAKGATRGLVSVKAAQASLDRGLQEVSKVYGFDLAHDDPRFSVVATRREGDRAVVSYGANGRQLDASQLAYELNN